MKSKCITALLAGSIFSASVFAEKVAPSQVEIDKYGVAQAQYSNLKGFRGFKWYYLADTKTELCYMLTIGQTVNSSTVIPCSNLAKREEWAPIITWVKSEASE